jgi:hypothetical protein
MRRWWRFVAGVLGGVLLAFIRAYPLLGLSRKIYRENIHKGGYNRLADL